MRILVVGAGPNGTAVLRQLAKNPELQILVLDAAESPDAVEQGVVDRVDVNEVLTPLNLELVLEDTRPDLILWTLSTEEMALGSSPGMEVMAKALREEIASVAEVPVVQVERGS